MRTRILSLWLCAALLSLVMCLPVGASDARETPLVRAVKRAQTAVVNIHSEKTANDKDTIFGGTPGRKVNGMGTGIIVDERGYIVTNQHVIADVESLRVTLHDGSSFNARVINFDKKTDLAIIKVEPTTPLPVMPLGTSADLMLGETVVAIGNAFGYEHTVTSGILSQVARDVEVNETQAYKNLLQTDASINPGNSGGPLINLEGHVVGINVAIRAGAQRIGFAIPIDDARKVIARLLNGRKLSGTYHGILCHDVKKSVERMRLVVDGVESGSPAATAGFQPGDVILQAGGVAVTDQVDLERLLLGHAAGEAVPLVVSRGESRLNMSLELAKDSPLKVTAASNVRPVVRANNPDTDDASWRLLGVRLTRVSASQLEASKSGYSGGMRVLEVRPDSPAAKNGILQGDVLVGLHVWQTVSSENVSYILNHPQLMTFNPLKFFVVRGELIRYGYLRLNDLDK